MAVSSLRNICKFATFNLIHKGHILESFVKMTPKSQIINAELKTCLKDIAFVGIGSYCFCCWEFAALSRPSNWYPCEQRSLLYGWHILCLLPPILGRPLFKSWLHVTNTSNPKRTFHDNTIIQKCQKANYWASIWSRPWLVSDSNRQKTSCEWGLTLYSGCQLLKCHLSHSTSETTL